MPRFVRDLSYAARSLTARPWVSVAIVLTLALGIGANTAVFSVVNAVLFRPLPYHDGERLVWLWSTDPKNPHGAMGVARRLRGLPHAEPRARRGRLLVRL
jgi:hypothetical protein